MIDNETLIFILFLAVSILSAICVSILDSRNYWRKKWEEDEEYILVNIRGKNDK